MNRLKEKLYRGDVATMINPNYPSGALVEHLGKLGFDAVFLDCEHGPAGPERVEELARAARAGGISSVLRPEAAFPHLIIRYLDRGVDGIMVPHVDDADTARKIVEAVRYGRARDHGDKLVIAQIESLEAVGNIPQIAAVDGIDMLFVGPGDLSQAMGRPGEMYHPEVCALVDRAIADIRKAGKLCGTIVRYDDVERLVDSGVQYLYIHTNTFLARAAREFQSLLKPRIPS